MHCVGKAPCLFTIATSSHVALSVVFFENTLVSFRGLKHKPELYLFLLGFDRSLQSTLGDLIHIVNVESILDRVLIERFADLYTPAEFCYALKPFLFRWLLDQFDTVFYFDSDIWIIGSFDEFMDELGDSPILLTPHYLKPFGCSSIFGVRALSLLRGGVFNAGFLAVNRSEQAHNFLHWWSDHVSRHGRNDPDNGMCGDQRWLDLVPVLFPDTKVSRHPGLNVGYWNIHERVISDGGNIYLVNGFPLLFVHFSGFDPEQPLAFSTHLPSYTAEGVMARICNDYAFAVKSARSKLSILSCRYAHRRWWHRFVKPYRWIMDLFINPRQCR